MSDTIINWRFGTYHLKILKCAPFIQFRQNPYHIHNKPDTWFERYE